MTRSAKRVIKGNGDSGNLHSHYSTKSGRCQVVEKSYYITIFDRREYTNDRYTAHGRSKAEAIYNFIKWLLDSTDTTFDDFEIIKVEEKWWRK